MSINPADDAYKGIVQTILSDGDWKTSRQGSMSDTLDVFGYQYKLDLREGFPLLTTKKVDLQNVYYELMWMLRGDTNINTLKSTLKPYPDGRKRTIWDEWAREGGELGPIYGYQWRKWIVGNTCCTGETIDQIRELIKSLKETPDSRRHIVTAWNPAEIPQMQLPPCHCFFQCSVVNGFLDLHLYQRSADTALGVPYNMAQYALLQTLLAKEAGLTPRYFTHSFGSVHIYRPHLDALADQIRREPFHPPELYLRPENTFFDFVERDDFGDVQLVDYQHHPYIPYKIEV